MGSLTSRTGSSSARSARDGRFVRDCTRDQRHHDRQDASKLDQWTNSSQPIATHRRLGAVAVLLTDGSFHEPAATINRWSHPDRTGSSTPCAAGASKQIRPLAPAVHGHDSVAVLKHGVEPGQRTWATRSPWRRLDEGPGSTDYSLPTLGRHGFHRDTILNALGISQEKDFSTFPYLGVHIGAVSLADHRGPRQK